MESTIIRIDYDFQSFLEEEIDKNYMTTYFGTIFKIDIETEKETQIGSLIIHFLQLEEASNNRLSYIDIFDRDEYILRVGNKFMDYLEEDFHSEIQKFYNHTFVSNNVAFIKNFEIDKKFKDKDIEKKIFQNFCYRFSSNLGLIVAETFPLQFEPQIIITNEQQSEAFLQFNYKELQTSPIKLQNLYWNIGFDHIDGFNDLMFFNPLKQ